jgi:hypothetical protein
MKLKIILKPHFPTPQREWNGLKDEIIPGFPNVPGRTSKYLHKAGSLEVIFGLPKPLNYGPATRPLNVNCIPTVSSKITFKK